jgi:hypothetical protein
MINLSELATAPEFRQTLVLIRRTGCWSGGRWIPRETRTEFTGVTHPATGKELEALPEADRTKNARAFYGLPFHRPLMDTSRGLADEIEYRGRRFKLIQYMDYEDCGFWQATGIEVDAPRLVHPHDHNCDDGQGADEERGAGEEVEP